MVRKLVEKDRASAIAFLSAEPSINLFALGDIELFGFEREFQDVWGSFDEQGELDGVLLRYRENFILIIRTLTLTTRASKRSYKTLKAIR